VVHRDLKLENIVVDSQYNLKLCDFSLARTFAEGSCVGVYYSRVGTERYMAPELVEGKPYKGNTTDIFALGVVLFVLVTGVMPFHQRASVTDQLYQYVYKDDEQGYWDSFARVYQGSKALNKTVSEEFKRFIWQFFSYHYFERITLERIRGSKWMNGPLPNKAEFMQEMDRRREKQ